MLPKPHISVAARLASLYDAAMSHHVTTPPVPPRPVVGLVLGAGGARGCAHIGVVTRLQELGFEFDLVVGTSAGSIVGAALAANRLPVLRDVATHLDWQRAAALFFEVGLPRAGVLTGRHIVRFLRDILGTTRIEDLPLPFAAVATDLHAHQEVVLASGDLVEAVRASIALPGILTPARLADRHLVDGGLLNPLPVSVARRMGATHVLAVDVNLKPGRGLAPPTRTPARNAAQKAHPASPSHLVLEAVRRRLPKLEGQVKQAAAAWLGRHSGPSIFDVLTQTLRIFENQITQARLLVDAPDLLIQPGVGDLATLEFHRAEAAIAAGVAAVDALPGLPDWMRRAPPTDV